MTDDDLRARLTLPSYPRSARYDPRWPLENLMGPNVLWLAEALTDVMDLRPGMRVLDLGAGRALSSIFLAQEFDLQVWATDLWIGATENQQRIETAGMSASVFPIHAEAHTLPFAHDFFDALISLDAYHYFGTDDLYARYIARFLKSGAPIGIIVPGIREEIEAVPAQLAPHWPAEFWTFHSPRWWARHWERSGALSVERADMLPEGTAHWRLWEEVAAEYGYAHSSSDIDLLRSDTDGLLGFTRVVARVG